MSPSKLLSAAVVALSLTACTDEAPVIPSKVEHHAVILSSPEPVAVVAPLDAGVFEAAPATLAPDVLALAHDAGTVDHLGRSKRLVSEGDVRGALAEARRALYSAPTDDEVLTTVAKLGRRAGRPDLSAEAWGRLAVAHPTDPVPSLQQARALLVAKDPSGAVIAGREAISRDGGNPEGFQVTGLAQLELGELAGAMASFEKVVSLEPRHGWAWNNLGLARLRANENAKAIEALEKAAELLPTVATVHNNLGIALERVGLKDEAKAAYQLAMDLSPKYVKARLNAARVAQAPVQVEGGDTASDLAHPLPELEER